MSESIFSDAPVTVLGGDASAASVSSPGISSSTNTAAPYGLVSSTTSPGVDLVAISFNATTDHVLLGKTGCALEKCGHSCLDLSLLRQAMDCPFCDHPRSHKHGKTSNGNQRFRCASCSRTFTETIDTLYYRRQVTPEQVEMILQAHAEGSSLRGISRIGKRAYGTVVDIVRAASYKAQLIHNEEVADIECDQVIADEMWSFVKKSRSDVGQTS